MPVLALTHSWFKCSGWITRNEALGSRKSLLPQTGGDLIVIVGKWWSSSSSLIDWFVSNRSFIWCVKKMRQLPGGSRQLPKQIGATRRVKEPGWGPREQQKPSYSMEERWIWLFWRFPVWASRYSLLVVYLSIYLPCRCGCSETLSFLCCELYLWWKYGSLIICFVHVLRVMFLELKHMLALQLNFTLTKQQQLWHFLAFVINCCPPLTFFWHFGLTLTCGFTSESVTDGLPWMHHWFYNICSC